MPVARCRDAELHSDLIKSKQETRTIEATGEYNIECGGSRGWAAGNEFEVPRQQCTSCSRFFSLDVIQRHNSICVKVNHSRRPVYDSARARAKNTDIEMFFPDFRRRAEDSHSKRTQPEPLPRLNWRTQSATLRQIILEHRLRRRQVQRAGNRSVGSSSSRPSSAASQSIGFGRRMTASQAGRDSTDRIAAAMMHGNTHAHTKLILYQKAMRPKSSPAMTRGFNSHRLQNTSLDSSISGNKSSGIQSPISRPATSLPASRGNLRQLPQSMAAPTLELEVPLEMHLPDEIDEIDDGFEGFSPSSVQYSPVKLIRSRKNGIKEAQQQRNQYSVSDTNCMNSAVRFENIPSAAASPERPIAQFIRTEEEPVHSDTEEQDILFIDEPPTEGFSYISRLNRPKSTARLSARKTAAETREPPARRFIRHDRNNDYRDRQNIMHTIRPSSAAPCAPQFLIPKLSVPVIYSSRPKTASSGAMFSPVRAQYSCQIKNATKKQDHMNKSQPRELATSSSGGAQKSNPVVNSQRILSSC